MKRLIVPLAALLLASPLAAKTPEEVAAAALKAAPVWDGHNDVAEQLRERRSDVIAAFDFNDTTHEPDGKGGTSTMHRMLRALRKPIMRGVYGDSPARSRIRVKKVEDFPRQGPAHPADLLQIGQACRRHGAGRAEMLQQRTLAARPDAGDLVQRIGADGGAALLAMGADSEAVRFVA